MNRLQLLALAPLLLGASPQDPATATAVLRYAPVSGAPVIKSWTATHNLTMQSFGSQLADEPPVTYPISGRMESSQAIQVTDTLKVLGEGRPQVLERRFDKLASVGTLKLEGDVAAEQKAKLTSELEGMEVRYTWVPEENTYGKFYFGADGDESDLAPLGEDMDLRCVLPSEGAQVGSTWPIEAHALIGLFAPCGEVQLRTAEGSDRRLARSLRFGMGGGLEYAFRGKNQAEATITWAETRVENGQRLAVLQIKLDGRFIGEKAEILGEDVLMLEAARGARFDRVEVVLRLEGNGEILWNLDANQAHSMQLNASEDATLRVIEETRDGRDLVQTLTMRGLVKLGYSIVMPEQGPTLEETDER